jgi:hypothetical protein
MAFWKYAQPMNKSLLDHHSLISRRKSKPPTRFVLAGTATVSYFYPFLVKTALTNKRMPDCSYASVKKEMASSSERVDDNNQELHLQGQCVLAPRNPAASEEDRTLEPAIMSSPLALFFQVTLKHVTDELPRGTLIVSDNPRAHGDPFRSEQPLLSLPGLDDYVPLEGFLTHVLQEQEIAPSNTSILNDNACSKSNGQVVTPPFKSFSAGDMCFKVDTEDSELVRPLSISGHTSSSSRMFKSDSYLDLEEDTRPHILESTMTAVLRHQNAARLSDFIKSTHQCEDLEEGDDQELSSEDFTIFGVQQSPSSIGIFQESFHTMEGPEDEGLDLGKEISPTGVMDHTFLHQPLSSLQKIKDELVDLKGSNTFALV